MSRKTILILCSLNALIALAVLSHLLPKLVNKPLPELSKSPAESQIQLSDNELWLKATSSNTEREVRHYLSLIEDTSFKRVSIEALLTEKSNNQKASDKQVSPTHYSLLIGEYAQLATTLVDVELLILIINNKAQSITTREAALRNYIQAFVRLHPLTDNAQHNDSPSDQSTAQCYELIDSAYTQTGTSLVGLAIQADWFLEQNKRLSDERRTALEAILKERLSDPHALQSNQLTCLNILNAPSNHDLLSNDVFYLLYERSTSDTIKETILSFFANKKDQDTFDWIQQLEPVSSRLEQLRSAALRTLQSH